MTMVHRQFGKCFFVLLAVSLSSGADDLRKGPRSDPHSEVPSSLPGRSSESHWAFQTPLKPPVPVASDSDWVRNPIDNFVLQRLRSEDLSPSPSASDAVLLRRLSLDLIGLPPSIEELTAFVSKTVKSSDINALDQYVNQLLASEHYGEHWGRQWLDAARYADSDGFEKDKPRSVWMYRSWVIRALNRDLPFDQFVLKQIAGDLLPNRTQDDLVATGFLRNSMINEEGGIDPEQFRMEAMFDRMDAIGKAILGLTIQCSQCHDHKYDPLSQTDYYRMFAFINNSHEGSAVVYPKEALKERKRIHAAIDREKDSMRTSMPDWKGKVAQWAHAQRDELPRWNVAELEHKGDNGQRYERKTDGSVLAQGYAPSRFTSKFETSGSDLSGDEVVAAIRLELFTDPNLPAGGPGRGVNGLAALTDFKVELVDAGGKASRIKLTSANADFGNERKQLELPYATKDGKRGFVGPASYAIDDDATTAWGIDRGPGRRSQSCQVVFVLEKPIQLTAKHKLRFHFGQTHGGWNSDDNQTLNLGRFRISLCEDHRSVVKILPVEVETLLRSQRTETTADLLTLFNYWSTTREEFQRSNQTIEDLWAEHPEGTTQLILQERSVHRMTSVLNRGDFLQPLEETKPGVPSFLHEMIASDEPDRLRFARWLVDSKSPTTARAVVNRVWQSYFGHGLVETSEDLGTQGDQPSHPALLDWLAVDFVDNGWSLKRLHKLIVSSATYRQQSRVTALLYGRDQSNQLLARGPRVRVDAESVRDIFLTASGLLERHVGGPSVYPPAPQFLFLPPASYGPKSWKTELGRNRYRRSLYTFRFRSVPYPALEVFDVPPGNTSCVRRSRSNTPLQALVTLNEPIFVESSRALARELLSTPRLSDHDRIREAFLRCVSRSAEPAEEKVLRDLLQKQRRVFAESESRAKAMIGMNEHEHVVLPAGVSVSEIAAWTVVARVVLNLDETITKE